MRQPTFFSFHTVRKKKIRMSKDIWGRLHNDRRSRDQEIDKIARFRSEVEKEESECLSRRTTARKHTTREPNPVILDRARTRRVERMTASMLFNCNSK